VGLIKQTKQGYCFTIHGARGPGDPPSVSSYWLLQGVHFTSPSNGWAVGIDKAT